MQNSLAPLDFFVIGAYIVGLYYIGFRFRHHKTTTDYYLAGRNMSGLLTGISVTVTLLSAVSLMGLVAFTFEKNMNMVVASFPGLLAIPIINRVILPFYHRLPITTSYEYLERRFDSKVRIVASAFFVLLRLFYLSVVIYAPSVALSVATGRPLYQNVLIMGISSVTLAMLGGMRAVIWSEVLKFAALAISFASILITLFRHVEGGFAEAWALARSGGRLDIFNLSLDPTATFATSWIIIGVFFQILATFGTDQIVVQRYLSSRSLEESRKAYTVSAWTTLPINIFLALSGVGFYIFYKQHPNWDQGLMSADQVLPHFAIHHLPRGLTGLVIATIFSAALSTHSSGVHALNTVVMNDFFGRRFFATSSGKSGVGLIRLGNLFWGALTTMLALYVSYLGMIIVAAQKINQFFGGALLGMFLLGMLFARPTSWGVLIGASAGLLSVGSVAMLTSISYFWYAPIGCLVTGLIGYLASLLFRPPDLDRIRGFHLGRESAA